VIEHDMPLITSISDRMVALELGHPIVEGAPAEVIRDPQVVESYLGGDIAAINRSGRPGVATDDDATEELPAPKPRRRRKPLVAAGVDE
jgi:hypothetical protein